MFKWKPLEEREQYGPHVWVSARLGHSSTMCQHCCGTPNEIAVIGDMNHCERRPGYVATGDRHPLGNAQSLNDTADS